MVLTINANPRLLHWHVKAAEAVKAFEVVHYATRPLSLSKSDNATLGTSVANADCAQTAKPAPAANTRHHRRSEFSTAHIDTFPRLA